MEAESLRVAETADVPEFFAPSCAMIGESPSREDNGDSIFTRRSLLSATFRTACGGAPAYGCGVKRNPGPVDTRISPHFSRTDALALNDGMGLFEVRFRVLLLGTGSIT